MTNETSKTWQLNRRVNLSVVIQLVLLASLIVGSWFNLQRQLDLLQHDVTMLVESNRTFQKKLESLSAKTIAHEYRLRTVEKTFSKAQTQ